MIAFASNSLLCRLALKQTGIDAASFTTVRIFSGALALWLIMQGRRTFIRMSPLLGNPSNSSLAAYRSAQLWVDYWSSAVALFVYAAAFSFAYIQLPAGTGALLLFGAVQVTMIRWGLHKGERLDGIQITGLTVAMLGLIVLVLPRLSAPPLLGSLLMIGAGVAWGIYSVRGKHTQDPVAVTSSNFLRALPFAVLVSIITARWMHLDWFGVVLAAISGAITSGLGYVIWYAALPGLKAASAATVQLSVPVLAAAGGILFLGEPITLRYALAAIAVLGGIALVVLERSRIARPRGS